jgi:hypothetical protein
MARNRNSVRYIASFSGALAKQLRKATLRFVVSICYLICPNGRTRLTLGGFLPNMYGFLLESAYQVQFTFEGHEDRHCTWRRTQIHLPNYFSTDKKLQRELYKKSSKSISYPMNSLLKILHFTGQLQEIGHSQRGRSEHNMAPHDAVYMLGN